MEDLYKKACTSPTKRKVLGDIHNTGGSPISPTANLKLLTKVASQVDLIENAYCIKEHVKTPPKVKCESLLNPFLQGKTLRKFKSLGFLCDKFLKLYPLDLPEEIHSKNLYLSDLANQLGVEKRRVYDIINVVESLQMATKVGKNSYTWTGRRRLADTLSQLKAWAEQVGLVQCVRTQQLRRRLYLNLQLDEIEFMDTAVFEENSKTFAFFRNERRISCLCQKFLMLFLVSFKDGLINLELAAEVLVGKDCQQNKTRLRRLYDIANILTSLGIITKLDLNESWKKPVFKYAGPPLQKIGTRPMSRNPWSDTGTKLLEVMMIHKHLGLSNDVAQAEPKLPSKELSNENSLLSNLVKTELSDEMCSDSSEESCDTTWKIVETNQSQLSVTESDHSYSLDLKKSESSSCGLEPVVKKRLVFSSKSSNELVCNSSDTLVRVAMPSTPVVTNTVLRVMGEGNVPQPITNGGVYKALKVGNDYHFIRIEDS